MEKTESECFFFPFPASNNMCFSTSYGFPAQEEKYEKKKRKEKSKKYPFMDWIPEVSQDSPKNSRPWVLFICLYSQSCFLLLI